MIHLNRLVYSIFYEICGRPPTAPEFDEYSRKLLFQPSAHAAVCNEIYEQHIKSQSKRFLIFDKDEAVEQDIDISLKSLLVVGMVRNISSNLQNVKDLIHDLRKGFKKVSFFFYHNNSTDDSESKLREWMDGDIDIAGTFAPNNVVTVIDSQTKKIGNRIPMFARMRNQNIADAISHFGKSFDYVLISNTDLVGRVDTSGIFKSLRIADEWDVICGNCCFANSYYHYDAYALRLLGEPDDIRQVYTDFDKYYGINTLWLDRFHVFDAWTKVRSGFGDMCLIPASKLFTAIDNCKGEICKVDEGTPHICELISMCDNIGKNIWISPYINYPATMTLEGFSVPLPTYFVPRDAGFFSVFNFFMGQLMRGGRSYPYFYKPLFDERNKENKHFCYWSSKYENSWFAFFEPVKFYHGDTEHEDKAFLSYIPTSGEHAGGEFRLHTLYTRLMNDKDLFGPWRKSVNAIFRKFIHIRSDIIQSADKFWNSAFIKGSKVIGVHFRHPSHYVESGRHKMKDYFTIIDNILETYPDAKLFIATDTEFGLMTFSYKYGSRVSWIPGIERVDIDNILDWAHAKRKQASVADAMDFIDGQGFQLHYTKCGASDGTSLGKDVLKEVLCLSKCDWFIHTTSNVALAVSYINPDLNMIMLPKNTK